MGYMYKLLGGVKHFVSVKTCENHCQDNEQCVYYTYLLKARTCIMHGYSVTVFAPVSIENCGDNMLRLFTLCHQVHSKSISERKVLVNGLELS